MHLSPKQFLHLAKYSVQAWNDDRASSMGAAIAFYTVFSIAPLLIIVIAVAGSIWGEDAIRGEIFRQLGGLLGSEAAQSVQSLIRSADKPTQGAAASMASIVILLVGATRVFAELQSALDRIWQTSALQHTAGWWRMLRARLLSLGLVLGLSFLLLVSLIIGTALAMLGSWFSGFFPNWELVLQVLNAITSLAVSTILFAVIFKYMPQASIAWRDVWVGAMVTAILFEIGKVLISLYVGKSSTVSSLTAASSFTIVLIWVYYATQVFLLGAEFTWFYANYHGSRRGADAPGKSEGDHLHFGQPQDIASRQES